MSNILLNQNEEDHFDIAFQLMIDDDSPIGGIGENFYGNEVKVEFNTESEQIENNSFSQEKESNNNSKIMRKSNSVCKIIEKEISLDISEKSKSCKILTKINLLLKNE